MLNGMYRKLKTIADTTLAHQSAYVGFHRAFRDEKFGSNFFVRSPPGE